MAKAMVRAVDEVGVHYSSDGVLELITPGGEEDMTEGGHWAGPRSCLREALVDLDIISDKVCWIKSMLRLFLERIHAALPV